MVCRRVIADDPDGFVLESVEVEEVEVDRVDGREENAAAGVARDVPVTPVGNLLEVPPRAATRSSAPHTSGPPRCRLPVAAIAPAFCTPAGVSHSATTRSGARACASVEQDVVVLGHGAAGAMLIGDVEVEFLEPEPALLDPGPLLRPALDWCGDHEFPLVMRGGCR
jgi:hypothetical protein